MTKRARGILLLALCTGLLLAGITLSTLARSEADQRAAEVEAEVMGASRSLAPRDVRDSWATSLSEMWAGGDPEHLRKALFPGVGATLEGTAFSRGLLSVTFSTGWAWENRCIHALLGETEPRVQTTKEGRCSVREPGDR